MLTSLRRVGSAQRHPPEAPPSGPGPGRGQARRGRPRATGPAGHPRPCDRQAAGRRHRRDRRAHRSPAWRADRATENTSTARTAAQDRRRLGLAVGPDLDPAFLKAVIEADGGDFGTVRQSVIGFADVQRLLTRRVDGVPAFWNVEGVAVRARGGRSRSSKSRDYGGPPHPGGRDRHLARDAGRRASGPARGAVGYRSQRR